MMPRISRKQRSKRWRGNGTSMRQHWPPSPICSASNFPPSISMPPCWQHGMSTCPRSFASIPIFAHATSASWPAPRWHARGSGTRWSFDEKLHLILSADKNPDRHSGERRNPASYSRPCKLDPDFRRGDESGRGLQSRGRSLRYLRLENGEQAFQQLDRVWRTAADMEIDGNDSGDTAGDGIAAGKDAAVE